jgi:hypothetical protein
MLTPKKWPAIYQYIAQSTAAKRSKKSANANTHYIHALAHST